MGKSRSATAIIAHLLSTHPTHHSPTTALTLLRRCRPLCEPNPGFMTQLHLYHRMRCPDDIASHPQYQRWCWERARKESLQLGQPPGSEFIVFEDEVAGEEKDRGGEIEGEKEEGEKGEKNAETVEEYRCRRCRTSLGNSHFRIPHTPPPLPPSRNHNKNKSTTADTAPACAHLFLSPLSWMRPTLAEGNLEGRLECPNGKCGQNVGKYAWQGMKCSCGEWVVPGISVGRGRVDVVNVVGRKKKGGEGRI
ncbi:MAG: hypothetical protein LQ349_003591 [Xanthoria aureola]|nr:MAG: hypothetical protein LQ349_003591 [Xanthoria aureola]